MNDKWNAFVNVNVLMKKRKKEKQASKWAMDVLIN